MTVITDDIERIVNQSFLARVPEIMAAHPDFTIAEAIKAAFDADEAFCYRMMLANESERRGLDKGADEAIRLLSAKTYERLRN